MASIGIRPGDPVPEEGLGLLLTGGGDVDPTLYGEVAWPETAGINRARDDFERNLVRAFLNTGRPVVGICRGIQVINVALGGRLIQHLPALHFSEMHGQVKEQDSRHGLVWTCEARLSRPMTSASWANSSHHQAIHPEGLAEGLAVVARSAAGVVEAVEGRGLPAPVLGVQWHPERLPEDHPASAGLLAWMRSFA